MRHYTDAVHAKYPDFLTDSAEAVAWAYRNMGQYGAVTGFFVGGSSAGGYISQIQFNNGQLLDIAANDIVIFVGPNNAGKSQSLKDIFNQSVNDTEVKKIILCVSDISDDYAVTDWSSIRSEMGKLINNAIVNSK